MYLEEIPADFSFHDAANHSILPNKAFTNTFKPSFSYLEHQWQKYYTLFELQINAFEILKLLLWFLSSAVWVSTSCSLSLYYKKVYNQAMHKTFINITNPYVGLLQEQMI